jgi:hypothetical protein
MGTGRMSRGRWHYLTGVVSTVRQADTGSISRSSDLSLVSRLETAIVIVLVVVLVLGF